MNIFVLDLDPVQAAKWHTDRHCVKMILESAQLLCSVFHMQGIDAPYKLTHKNHPCAVWARESYSNFIWLLNLFEALCEEYTVRYGRYLLEYCRYAALQDGHRHYRSKQTFTFN